jgi:hypothetical protein
LNHVRNRIIFISIQQIDLLLFIQPKNGDCTKVVGQKHSIVGIACGGVELLTWNFFLDHLPKKVPTFNFNLI